MTTETEQTTGATENGQGSHHFILTVQKPTASGYAVNCFYGTLTPPPGATRQDAYQWIRDEHDRLYPEMAGGSVLFLSLERNEL